MSRCNARLAAPPSTIRCELEHGPHEVHKAGKVEWNWVWRPGRPCGHLFVLGSCESCREYLAVMREVNRMNRGGE